jgi:NADH:ubiquinone reductase (H+-translocating)
MARPERDLPQVVIIGGGFGGLEVAKRLARAPVQTTLIDRRNYHLFQPMLYQVATAALSPTDIASSIRQVLRHISNCRVVLATATGIDLSRQLVRFGAVGLKYDYLVLAAGATHAYFGNDQWADWAPGLKTLEGATEIRRRILLAFETAEYEGSQDSRRAELTFAVVGGGPTGVELAGAIKEIASQCLSPDFRNIDTKTTRVILIQSNDRLLPQFDPKLSRRAQQDLEAMGVEVRLNSRVTDVNADGLRIGDQFVPARNVFWAAGVAANPLGASLGVTTDRSGRVPVEPDLSLPGHPNLFVIGDMAAAKSAASQQPVPGVAQGAIQMGRHVARIIAAETAGQAAPRQPFNYRDKGSMATIGKAKAVVQIGRWRFGGFPAWLLWGGIHIFFLVGFRNRVVVFSKWLWNWLISARDARLILGDAELRIEKLLDEEVVQLSGQSPSSHPQPPPIDSPAP